MLNILDELLDVVVHDAGVFISAGLLCALLMLLVYMVAVVVNTFIGD